MTANAQTAVTAFAGARIVATGPLAEALPSIKAAADAGQAVLIFSDATARVLEVDLRGNLADAQDRLPSVEARGPGRPKLGVVAREVTLLPRHWDWLATQPGGASVALRKLVEAAARDPKAERLAARDAAYRFASAMGGDKAGFDEAMRALYAGKRKKFHRQLETWPPDVREHLEKMAAPVFSDGDEE